MKNGLRKAARALGWGALLGAVFFFGSHHLSGWAKYEGPVNVLGIDLGRPDGVIVTQSLAKLPRDVLKVPLLKDLLTEDFVFYYERGEDRLGLIGSLRRLAYEHDLKMNDRLVELVLDEPAELAFWRDAKGSAEYTLLAMTRSRTAKLIQGLAGMALKDSQLTLAATLQIGSEAVPVYALRYGRERTLLLLSSGNRIVVLSDPGMLLKESNEPDPSAVAVVGRLLAGNGDDAGIYRKLFALPEGTATHRIAVSARFLSFGYQHFFPDLKTVRFDYDKEWSTHLRLASPVHQAYPDTPTLAAMPARAAACAWLPVSWGEAGKVVGRVEGAPAVPALKGPGSVCWYANSELHTPVFAAELAAPPDTKTDAALQAFYTWAVVGDPEVTMAGGEPNAADHARIEVRNPKTQRVSSLGRRGQVVVFSPDYDLVQRAVDTLDRRYPSLADVLPPDAGVATVAVLTPRSIGELASQAIYDTLPNGRDVVLRDAADHHLPGRLKALERHPAYRLALVRSDQAGEAWHPVRWDALAAQP